MRRSEPTSYSTVVEMAAAATTPPLNEGQQNGDYPSQVDDANSDTSSKLIIANDLQNEDQKRLFDAIDALRDHGVGRYLLAP